MGEHHKKSTEETEASRSVAPVAGLAYPIASTFYSVPGVYRAVQVFTSYADVCALSGNGPYNPDANSASNTNEPYLDLQNYLLSLPDAELPSVLTTSYGDDEQTVPYEYAVRVCRGYAALGVR